MDKGLPENRRIIEIMSTGQPTSTNLTKLMLWLEKHQFSGCVASTIWKNEDPDSMIRANPGVPDVVVINRNGLKTGAVGGA